MTYLQAKEHLEAVIRLASAKNQYLACVRNYLRGVNIDVLHIIRAQELVNYEHIITIIDLQERAERAVTAYLSGQALENV